MSLHLVLFFTSGMSLRQWDEGGMFTREVALYQRLAERGVRISFVTYGDATDLAYRERLPGINILCNCFGWPHRTYARWLKALHAPALGSADVLKIHQMNGADVALSAARWWRKPLLARCGYLWSELTAYHQGENSDEVRYIRTLEARVFAAAAGVVVTTPAMAVTVADRYAVPPAKLRVIPNFVDTARFTPGDAPAAGRLCFVGRLSHEKNVLELVRACAGLEVELVMAGDGALRAELGALAAQVGTNLHLSGVLPHAELPTLLRGSELFLLVSPHEGHPKTLIEAMACGLPVIGTDVPGIREVIHHGDTGWLCGLNAARIRDAIEVLRAQPELRVRLGASARRFAVEHFALDRIVELEYEALQAAARGGEECRTG